MGYLGSAYLDGKSNEWRASWQTSSDHTLPPRPHGPFDGVGYTNRSLVSEASMIALREKNILAWNIYVVNLK